ncbi:hypothetical protein HZS61_013115 [Fusarium oxysporum f. sp. conglutinans]|uniref:FAD linked oxidase N-terminal domain-containing protein n=1 Tax=Fusarium oxysporum f. sp. conglutinans TaxID=100902 RepID=A0A8H6GVV2_FUSOX|nr:hypothetical protein HZS61_013115 [Fusarium oxysporum f. sp. conglutinans]KAG6984256.1 FAD-linked oxidoreductase sorD [Fusarium oxysporum f. sp. conglutinans]
MFSFPVVIFTALVGAGTGAASSTPPSLRECLDGAGIQDYAFPSHPLYSLLKVKRWNLDIDVTPAVVMVPETAEQIAAIVASAQERGLKVQPKSGGHSFGNYALDHVEAVTIVLADGTITRASWTENKDLFWALKGAGAGFGIITEFVVRT